MLYPQTTPNHEISSHTLFLSNAVRSKRPKLTEIRGDNLDMREKRGRTAHKNTLVTCDQSSPSQ
ncbi:hypothetical protein V1478_006220 [Vespula squamosa]|uniref:Uncharacterized protein n=1 Tax=Vespula squamosa TaxID=30214 RepID=A0ABD2B799_VESSQ